VLILKLWLIRSLFSFQRTICFFFRSPCFSGDFYNIPHLPTALQVLFFRNLSFLSKVLEDRGFRAYLYVAAFLRGEK